VVKTVDCDTKFRDGRVIAWSLWCGSSHAKKGDRQPYVGLNNKPLSDPSAIPTYDVAAEKLIANIEEKHGCCLAAAEDAKRREHTADSARADGSPDIQTQNAFERMQAGARLAAAREVAAKANTAALAAEQEREAAEAEVAALERALDPKRQRVEVRGGGGGGAGGDGERLELRRPPPRDDSRDESTRGRARRGASARATRAAKGQARLPPPSTRRACRRRRVLGVRLARARRDDARRADRAPDMLCWEHKRFWGENVPILG
jgi:hypothetical protein